jgi:hypothetical protein
LARMREHATPRVFVSQSAQHNENKGVNTLDSTKKHKRVRKNMKRLRIEDTE